ncbi:MAG TPA: NeuD/PglB/VioB family sugar acetyltransferase [Gracilimonas sp.]|nr:NeuD/PglB/VioB family sugar acetyltransferase [Gracilimonas sp.]
MLVAGAGRHAKDLLSILEEQNEDLFFFDDVTKERSDYFLESYPVIRSLNDIEQHFQGNNRFVLGIGGTRQRKEICQKLLSIGGTVQSVISSHSIVSNKYVFLGDGLNVMPFVFISNSVSIGEGTLLNTRSSVHHDVQIGIYCDISPGATLLGGVKVGDFTHIGANATILPDIKIGNDCVIGAGAVVTKDIPDNARIKGVPAK